ncbi:MAG: adenylate kinase [Vicinamibacterales bacterium]
MRIVLLGPPGEGKGTQSKLLQEHFNIPQISTGDILRRIVEEGTAIGKRAKAYMDRGELVPDSVIIEMVDQRLDADDAQRGFLLDGFPRTVPQLGAFEKIMSKRNWKIDGAVSLKVPRADLIRRLSGRRTCRDCGAMYHVVFNPPKADLRCDRCGGELYQRADDREETITARLEVHDRQSVPLHEFFRKQGLLREIDGTKSTEEVFARILREVRQAA